MNIYIDPTQLWFVGGCAVGVLIMTAFMVFVYWYGKRGLKAGPK